MKTVVEGKIDVFAYRASLHTATFFASTHATLVVRTPRNWFGAFVSPPLPLREGIGRFTMTCTLQEVVKAGGLDRFVKNAIRDRCDFPQAVKTAS